MTESPELLCSTAFKTCAVCGQSFADEDQNAHLKSQHNGPHYFWFDAVGYRADKPSMNVGDFLKMMNRSGGTIIEDRNGERIYYEHNETIDLTRRPQLFIDLPTTMRRPML